MTRQRASLMHCVGQALGIARNIGHWTLVIGHSPMKFLLTFEKGETARWLGHLDILRTFERAIRRAELPIAFSAGFNPRAGCGRNT